MRLSESERLQRVLAHFDAAFKVSRQVGKSKTQEATVYSLLETTADPQPHRYALGPIRVERWTAHLGKHKESHGRLGNHFLLALHPKYILVSTGICLAASNSAPVMQGGSCVLSISLHR